MQIMSEMFIEVVLYTYCTSKPVFYISVICFPAIFQCSTLKDYSQDMDIPCEIRPRNSLNFYFKLKLCMLIMTEQDKL